MKNQIISIITPSFNQGKFIEETIQSVLIQRGSFYIDYIIMDGKSTDNTLTIIKKYENLLKKNCTVIKFNNLNFYIKKNKEFKYNNCLGISFRWMSKKDKGQADAINKGLLLSKGNILSFLNSDDIYYNDTLFHISKKFIKNTEFLYGKGMWISENNMDLLPYPTFNPNIYSLYYQCTLCQPTVFFSKKTFNKLGFFSLDLNCAFDYEYWMRGIFNKKTFKYCNKFLAKSRMYSANKSLSMSNKVSKEIKELRIKYYKNFNINKIILRFYKIHVDVFTKKKVKKLNKYLQS